MSRQVIFDFGPWSSAIGSRTVCLREALRDSVEVIELVPPAVRMTLTRGQESIKAFLPLAAFIDETMDILNQQPTPPEIVVERARFQRDAEAEHRFADTLAKLNAHGTFPKRAEGPGWINAAPSAIQDRQITY